MAAKKTNGFTLIELMIVMAIIGILAAIAYPSYTRHMQDSRRADCEGALMQLAAAMERNFSRNNAYSDIIAAGNFSGQCPLQGTPMYNLSIPPALLTPTTYTLWATPVAGSPQANDACGRLSLTNTLQKGQATGTLAQCWK
jgi:type IV pilus assembly protein PilE